MVPDRSIAEHRSEHKNIEMYYFWSLFEQVTDLSLVSALNSFVKALQKCRVQQSVRGKAKRSVVHDRSHL